MSKLYFREYDEVCYPIKSHMDFMFENGLNEIEVFLAKRETKTDYFYCKHYGEIGEKSDHDSKMCGNYVPKNGKSGICKHQGYTYEQTSETILLKKT